ncbi:MAG: hypothetical protein HUM72_24535 [Dolichospermum sp.]|nr:hypothetical protein [Dolichospermum sp.]
MSLTRTFSSSIIQTGDSCIIISLCVIFNYFDNADINDIINIFLKKNDPKIIAYNLDRTLFSGQAISPECKYVLLNYAIVNASNGLDQFNNQSMINSFQDYVGSKNLITELVYPSSEYQRIKEKLMQDDACLSLALHGSNWVHVIPIGYFKEFFTVDKGQLFTLGQDFNNSILKLFRATHFGDGILVYKQ